MTQRPGEAAGAVDAQNASTAPRKTAQTAVSHSYPQAIPLRSFSKEFVHHTFRRRTSFFWYVTLRA
jgi:hypothetical protein